MADFRKQIIFLVLLGPLVILTSCKNKGPDSEEIVLKNPTVIPMELEFESSSLSTILNMELFNFYELKKGELAQSKNNLIVDDFWYEAEFLSLLKKSRTIEPQTFGAKERLSIDLSFECFECKSAYFVRAAGNDINIATVVKKILKEPTAVEYEIPYANGKFEYNSEKTTLKLNGFIGFYLVLQDQNDELFIFELAGVNGDATPPLFEMSESCEMSEPINSNEGLVCIDTMHFEGNDIDGFLVPVKGQIYGDVATVSIKGKTIAVEPGDFFTRIKMDLFTGYNQIPVIVTDGLGNETESFIEIEMEDLKPPAKE